MEDRNRQDIIENNKLIAKFMGLKKLYHPTNNLVHKDNVWGDIDNRHKTADISSDCYSSKIGWLSYHSDWSWIIPVLEKIAAKGYKWEIGISPQTKEAVYHYCKIWSIGTIEGISPLDAVYGACVEFIKWYNNGNNK